jgi:hypothetical protein
MGGNEMKDIDAATSIAKHVAELAHLVKHYPGLDVIDALRDAGVHRFDFFMLARFLDNVHTRWRTWEREGYPPRTIRTLEQDDSN